MPMAHLVRVRVRVRVGFRVRVRVRVRVGVRARVRVRAMARTLSAVPMAHPVAATAQPRCTSTHTKICRLWPLCASC